MPFMRMSVFGMLGSVKSRNFVPLRVWKTVRRKKDDSRDSIPDGATVGSGYVHVFPDEDEEGTGSLGVRDRVIA